MKRTTDKTMNRKMNRSGTTLRDIQFSISSENDRNPAGDPLLQPPAHQSGQNARSGYVRSWIPAPDPIRGGAV